MSNFDVVIVGAGIAGISTAYYLATIHRITRILLIDERPPLTFTSDKSGSNYRNWWPHPSMAKLADHSIGLMDNLAESTDNIFNINRRGYAYFNRESVSQADLATYRQAGIGELRIHEAGKSSYQPAENPVLGGADILLGNTLIKQYAPFVSNSIQSMIHVRRAGWLSTRVMAHTMLDGATKRGLAEMRGTVTTIESHPNNHRLVVKTDSGEQTVTAQKVLLAPGPYLPRFARMLNTDFRMTNVYHKKLMLRDDGTVLPEQMPFMIFRDTPDINWRESERKYLKRYTLSDEIPGNLHIRRINNAWLHLGWAFNRQPSDVDAHYHDSLFPAIVTKAMAAFIPGLQQFADNMSSPIMVSGGFYTRTSENLPIIQQLDRSGIFVIGGLSGFGVMMACGIGDLMGRLIVGEQMPEYVTDFSLSRYDDPDYQQYIQQYGSGEL